MLVGFRAFGVCGPDQRAGVDLRFEQHLKGPVVLGAQLAIIVGEGLGGERLAAKPPVRVLAAGEMQGLFSGLAGDGLPIPACPP